MTQNPWIFSSSVKRNILFGASFDKELYSRVVKMCALDYDFGQWQDGDATLVGEKGVALSGGQKARIALARAAYRANDFEVILLDDPLYAVDQAVGRFIFKHCILDFFSHKTVVMSTNDFQYLEKADTIMIMNNGRVVLSGDYSTLKKSSHLSELRKDSSIWSVFLHKEQNGI